MSMRAHRLRKKVIIQSKTSSRDDSGDPVDVWSTYCTTWAAVEPVRGSEAWTGIQETATQQIVVILRWSTTASAITPAMRVAYGGSYYDIHSVVNPDAGDREIHLLCTWRHLPEGHYP